MPGVFSLATVVCTVCAPTNSQVEPCREISGTSKNHLISIFHPDFPADLWDRLLPHAELTLNIMRPWRPDPSLSAWWGLHYLLYDFSAHPFHLPGQLCLAFNGPDHRLS